MTVELDYQGIIIGSGFGGSVNTCRLAKKWPGKVLLLERGKRYPMGAFPRKPRDMANNFWNVPYEQRNRPGNVGQKELRGLFDIRLYKHMDAVVSAGLGGGSLIYANVFLQPPDEVFDERWPSSCHKAQLQPYYQVAKSVLGARPVPQNDDPRRKIVRTELFKQFAVADNRQSELVDINVFFGNDFDSPLPIGEQQRNRYGALQTSCVYCAECDVGCNTHSKNTTDLNYLFVAEQRYQANITTEVLAEKIIPINAQGSDDPREHGQYGYRVYWHDLAKGNIQCSATSKRVIVSAGTLGSNELLLRCRDHYASLPSISDQLGRHFSGNGDFLSFVIDGERAADPNYGPVITQKTDYNLFQDFQREHAFILEDASYPNFAAWYTEGVRPGFSHLRAIVRTLRLLYDRFVKGKITGPVGAAFKELLQGDLSYHSAVLLCMGLDNSAGKMTLDKYNRLLVDWPYQQNMALYQAVLSMGERFRKWSGGKRFIPLPNWYWPLRSNVTVHPLGGCRLATDRQQGVTDADPDNFGQVFGYQQLYVADGALLPTAVGANPVATITALSERVAEGITGLTPDPDGEL